MARNLNVAEVVNSIPHDDFLEWWAFGLLNGWFPVEQVDPKRLTPEQSAKVLEARHRPNGINHHSHAGL